MPRLLRLRRRRRLAVLLAPYRARPTGLPQRPVTTPQRWS